ncbi:hypothetical protein ACFS5L_02710 [Streptomyces phyllanthi]|uniref:hypothetical protein n=1 Tax=Streptomyces phyllanthi TaxID=1803180 RepID=UPI0018833E92|nr:hypothetical protein [Streptomyces phyllanthi]
MSVFIKLVEVGDPNGYTNRTIWDVAYEDVAAAFLTTPPHEPLPVPRCLLTPDHPVG